MRRARAVARARLTLWLVLALVCSWILFRELGASNASTGVEAPALVQEAAFSAAPAAPRSPAMTGAPVADARSLSEFLKSEVARGVAADREGLARATRELAAVQAQHRWNPRGNWPSLSVRVGRGDTLTHAARRARAENPGLLVDPGLLQRVNGLESDRDLRAGMELSIPLDRPSAEVSVGARWMLFMLGDEVAWATEVAVGRDGQDTPLGTFQIGGKERNPTWWPRGKPPVPYSDPENPLGTRWLAWSRDGERLDVGFHGTNDEASVGARASMGCVRLRNADVELLFDLLPEGAEVRVRP